MKNLKGNVTFILGKQQAQDDPLKEVSEEKIPS